VRLLIEYDALTAPDQPGYHPEIGQIAAGEDQCRLEAEEIGEFGLKPGVHGQIAVEQPAPGRGGAVVRQRPPGRGHHPRVPGQTPVVIAPEHDHLTPVEPHPAAVARTVELRIVRIHPARPSLVDPAVGGAFVQQTHQPAPFG
jgi:hypothetical protein